MIIDAVHPKQHGFLHLTRGAQFDKQIVRDICGWLPAVGRREPCFHNKKRNSGLFSIFGEI